MRCVLPFVLPGLLIAGCDGAGAPPQGQTASGPPAAGFLSAGPPAPSAQLRVRFGGLVDTIEVGAIERLPLREAALIAPDGAATPARYVSVDPMPRIATGQLAVSRRWNDPVSQDNALAALALTNPQAGAALRSSQQLLAMVSRAEIPLPDPVAYRRDWQNYRIRLAFGTPPGEAETIEIAAPAPPAR